MRRLHRVKNLFDRDARQANRSTRSKARGHRLQIPPRGPAPPGVSAKCSRNDEVPHRRVASGETRRLEASEGRFGSEVTSRVRSTRQLASHGPGRGSGFLSGMHEGTPARLQAAARNRGAMRPSSGPECRFRPRPDTSTDIPRHRIPPSRPRDIRTAFATSGRRGYRQESRIARNRMPYSRRSDTHRVLCSAYTWSSLRKGPRDGQECSAAHRYCIRRALRGAERAKEWRIEMRFASWRGLVGPFDVCEGATITAFVGDWERKSDTNPVIGEGGSVETFGSARTDSIVPSELLPFMKRAGDRSRKPTSEKAPSPPAPP